MRKILVLFMIIMLSCSPAECAKTKRSSRSKTKTQAQTQTQQAGFYSLSGKWTVSDTLGIAADPRQPGVDIEIIAEKFTFTIEEVKFYESSGEGTANIIYNCTIVDTRGNILNQRTWEYALPYDVKRESADTWIFTSEYLNGEDKITIKLKSSKTAEIRFEGMNFDETYPEDKYTFDVTCEAVKK